MANTTNFGWETPDDTDLVKDGAAAIRTLGGAIDTSLVDLKGGTTNQVLAKNSDTDMDFKWVADATGIPATIIDAKGDLIVGTAADTAGRLAVGTNGYTLVADSSTSTGLKWGFGNLNFGESFVSTAQTSTSTSYAGLTTAQTVTLTTGTKVLVLLSFTAQCDQAANYRSYMSVAVSGATTIAASDANSVLIRSQVANSPTERNGVAVFLSCTAGSNTFTAQFKQPDYTGTFSDRQMIVIDLGS